MPHKRLIESAFGDTNPASLKSLLSKAKRSWDANVEYDDIFNKYMHSLKPLKLPKFWVMVKILKDLVKSRNGDCKNAIDEFFRIPHAALPDTHNEYSFGDCLAFANTWSSLYLYDELFDIVTGKSDDSYNDLLDSLPFAGERFINKCQNGDFKNNADFKKSLRKCVGEWWFNYIYNGENYIRMHLVEEGKNRIPYITAKE